MTIVVVTNTTTCTTTTSSSYVYRLSQIRQAQQPAPKHIRNNNIRSTVKRISPTVHYIKFLVAIVIILIVVEAVVIMFPSTFHIMRRSIVVTTSVNGLAFKSSSSRKTRITTGSTTTSSSSSSSSFRKRSLSETTSSPIRRKSPPSPSTTMKTTSITSTVATPTTTTNSTTTISTTPISQQQQQQQQITATMIKKTSTTGGLRRLPMVKPPSDFISAARKSLYKVKIDSDMKNIRLRIRKYGAETINTLMIALCVPLRDIVTGYERQWKQLHPFERVVADLTASSQYLQQQKKVDSSITLSEILNDIHEGRKMILEAAKDWIFKIKNADTSRNAKIYTEEGIESLIVLYETYISPSLLQLIQIQSLLRTTPIVQTNTPAIVLVGAPNVGKSSIVRAISSATPEINNYPFTTRGMTLGHVEVFWSEDPSTSTTHLNENNKISNDFTSIGSGSTSRIVKAMVPDPRRKPGSISPEVMKGKYAFSQLCQIMDSPGLLVRPDHERNAMEALTLAAMQHLPTAVCYVMDLSGNAGDKCSSIQDQLLLRQEMRQRFPRRPWIDIVSKYDLGVEDSVLQQLEDMLMNDDGTNIPYIKLSIHDGTGVSELRTETLRMLSEVRVVLDAMLAIQEQQQQQQQAMQQPRIQ